MMEGCCSNVSAASGKRSTTVTDVLIWRKHHSECSAVVNSCVSSQFSKALSEPHHCIDGGLQVQRHHISYTKALMSSNIAPWALQVQPQLSSTLFWCFLVYFEKKSMDRPDFFWKSGRCHTCFESADGVEAWWIWRSGNRCGTVEGLRSPERQR